MAGFLQRYLTGLWGRRLIGNSGVESSTVRPKFFNLGLCPLPFKHPLEQQAGVVRIMLNNIESVCRKH
jgi:hypothetical protein